MRPQVTVLLNAHAGHAAVTADAIADALAGAGVDPAIQRTEGAHLQARVRDAVKDGSRVIVAAGGDGTVSTVASVLAGSEVALGVLPLGTLNHFAKDLGIPTDLDQASAVIAAAQTTRVDVGEVNGRMFVNNSGVGAYPHLVVERRRQRRTRWVSEAIAAATVLREYPQLLVEVTGDGVDRIARTPFVFVGNNEYQLDGDDFGARPRLDRGMLHLCMAPGMGRLQFAGLVASALIGRLAARDRFEMICLPALAIRSNRSGLLVSLDGEVAVLDTPLKYRIRPGALRVIVPAATGEARP
jgi:diacylglycerol kinase family enzyme